MTIAGQIGNNLRQARRQAWLTQEVLSHRAGLDRTEIGLLELGKRVPRLDTLIEVAQVTEADPAELIEGVTWHEPAGWDSPGWFTVVGLIEPAGLRVRTRGEADASLRSSAKRSHAVWALAQRSIVRDEIGMPPVSMDSRSRCRRRERRGRRRS